IERGPHSPTVELAGGGFDEQLFDSMTNAGSTNTLWWMRDGNLPSVPFQPVRRLRYLEARIDTIAHPPPHDGVRGFIAGSDDATWLVANNAAFEDHPEQGRWELTELHERLAEQWFDPSGFLVLSVGGQIAASCWTKIHELPVVRTGEIYVIFVAPEFRGRGYGELMLQHGLAIIRSKGVSIASLYVEDSNDAAIALYTKYGFTTKRLDELVSISR
ncbi:MAG: GNAT family N-acetyltransferase, partial [Acidobacteria bacterium]|nr:GNAT family N-acetyltransferase [Acidobacteriota bacterium]